MAVSLHRFSPARRARLEEDHVTDVRGGSSASDGDLATEGRFFQAYNQEAFRYFLALERERAQRSSRSLLLLLARVTGPSPARQRTMDAAVAEKLFSGLWLSTRETDFIGWFHEGRIAGAVLTQRPDASSGDMSREIHARVSRVLNETLPRRARHQLRLRVFQLKPGAAGQAYARGDRAVRS